MKVAYHNILHTTWLISQSYRKGLKKMSQAVGILPNNSANACFDEASGVRWCRHRLSRCVVAASVAAVGVFRCRRLRAAPDERLRLLKRLSSTLVDASFEDEVTAASADRRLRLSSSILSFDNSRSQSSLLVEFWDQYYKTFSAATDGCINYALALVTCTLFKSAQWTQLQITANVNGVNVN